jgi:PAS domain S-box-containing protein
MPRETDDKKIIGGLARRFIVFILLFSSFITLLGTSLQLYLDYSRDMGAINTALEQIEKSHRQSVINNLWVADLEQLQVHLQGMLDLPDVQQLTITKDQETIISLGTRSGERTLMRSYPLNYSFKGKNIELGTLHAYANLETVYRRLFDKIFLILVTQGVKTFLVSFFIFFLFYLLIGRHLEKLSRYAKGLTLENLDKAATLERKKKDDSPPDELDTVVSAINDMRVNLLKDIEARHQAEKGLRKNEKLLRAVIEGASDAISLKDLKGRYLLANEATSMAVGVPREEIIGKTDSDLFPNESGQVINAVESRVIESGKPQLVEERLATTFGNSYWLTNKSPLLDDDGKIIGLIGISRNITESKHFAAEKRELEERLHQSQKLEAIGILAGGIAHDFNNILSAIFGYTEMALEDAPPGTLLQNDLEMVLISANRAKDLVKQILTFSRQAKIDRLPIKIQPLVKEGLKMLRSSLPATIRISEDIDPHGGTVLVDPTQVHQIVMNLCTNAYHSMEDTGGTLAVSLQTTLITADDKKLSSLLSPGEYLQLTVSDTGTGIGPAIIDKIFDPYYTTKEINKGTGMGLAIVHGIMKDYGGTITVESRLGKGSIFNLYFPVLENEDLPAGKETEDTPDRGKERILFIDDEEILAEMGKAMLERLGYQVTIRRSSIEALTTFQNTPDDFDLVITDQTMPFMTGSDLARRMLQIRPDLPIILCTGYSNLVDESSAKALGIKEFALKPLTKGVIAKLVRNALAGKAET